MTPRQPRILVGCDGSAESQQALAWATDYAKSTDGTLTLVTAWQWPTVQGAPVVLTRDDDPREWALELLESVRAAVDLPDDRVVLDVVHGAPGQVLPDLAAGADLLVVGSHGLGVLSRLVLGSVSARCATHSPCPVAVVRGPAETAARKVVVGLDDSPAALTALRWAMDYADLMHWPLSVVHAVEIPAPPIPFGYPMTLDVPRGQVHSRVRQWLRETVAKAEADRGYPLRRGASFRVVEGSPAHALVRESGEAAIVVIGRRGAGGFGRLLMGSTAAAVAHRGTSTCVVTPPPVT